MDLSFKDTYLVNGLVNLKTKMKMQLATAWSFSEVSNRSVSTRVVIPRALITRLFSHGVSSPHLKIDLTLREPIPGWFEFIVCITIHLRLNLSSVWFIFTTSIVSFSEIY